MTESFSVSAPGSAMVMGEHAVLEGYPAIIAAVDYRITITLKPRSDRRVVIYSQLGEHSQSLDYLTKEPPFEGIIACCQLLQDKLSDGFELTINSQMSHQVGLGSSAAVIVATFAVLQYWQNGKLDRDQLLTWSQQAMEQQQGLGSGADLAASIYGGILTYQKQPLSIGSLPVPEEASHQTVAPAGKQNDDCLMNRGSDSVTVTALQFGLLYCGHKKPTAQVIQWLQQQFADQPQLLQHYYQTIGETVSLAIDAWQHQDWSTVCQQIAINQRYMEELGLCHEPLVKLKQLCDNDPYIKAAKISGSGLGDCLLGLGDWSRSELRHQANYIPMPIAQEGVVCH